MKDSAKRPSARRLTPDEELWHPRWHGQVLVVERSEDALRALGGVEIAAFPQRASPTAS